MPFYVSIIRIEIITSVKSGPLHREGCAAGIVAAEGIMWCLLTGAIHLRCSGNVYRPRIFRRTKAFHPYKSVGGAVSGRAPRRPQTA